MNTDMRLTPPKSNPVPREWMTVEQAAEYIGVHPKTLRKWYRNKQVPAYRAGPTGLIRIRRADLDTVIMTRYVPASVA